jgi:hypothetical protein
MTETKINHNLSSMCCNHNIIVFSFVVIINWKQLLHYDIQVPLHLTVTCSMQEPSTPDKGTLDHRRTTPNRAAKQKAAAAARQLRQQTTRRRAMRSIKKLPTSSKEEDQSTTTSAKEKKSSPKPCIFN